jgi:Lyzozyme M1 (1,4-beta-N-acetylmuramidase)
MKKRIKHRKKANRRKKIIVRCIGLLFVIVLLVFYRHYFVPGGTEISSTKYPVSGVDISKYNGKIDWDALEAQGIDFVFIKATEGEKYVDPTYNENLNGALEAGIPVGAYHFFRFDRQGTKQAVNFLENAQIHKLTLPVVIDVEEANHFTSKKKKSAILKELRDLINTVEKTTHQQVLIYTNEHTFQKYIEGNFPMNDLWISSFNDPPKVRFQWTFWQYTHKGRLKGIDHLVDINTFWGDRKSWKNYLEELEDQKQDS